MTVGYLKKQLEKFNDSDRIILDNGHYKADSRNEILYAIKLRPNNSEEPFPVVVLQTKDDFDVAAELKAALEHFSEENYDEADALSELFEMGYTLEDFMYDQNEYEWAKAVAEGHGLL